MIWIGTAVLFLLSVGMIREAVKHAREVEQRKAEERKALREAADRLERTRQKMVPLGIGRDMEFSVARWMLADRVQQLRAEAQR